MDRDDSRHDETASLTNAASAPTETAGTLKISSMKLSKHGLTRRSFGRSCRCKRGERGDPSDYRAVDAELRVVGINSDPFEPDRSCHYVVIFC